MIERETGVASRRQALGALLVTAGVAVASGIRRVFAAPAERTMKLGCGTVSFRKSSLKEAMERIARAGYEYVEPQATGPFCPHVDPWKDDPRDFRRLVSEFSFKGASALWSPNGSIISDPKSVHGISRAIRWAKEAGIPVVNAGEGRKSDGLLEEDALKLLRERLAQILEVANECRVYLAIEPHGTFSMTADGLKKIMDLSNSKWLGINYDTANVHRVTYEKTVPGAISWTLYGKRQDEVATLNAVADRVVHVHVKDVVGTKSVALGEGGVNIRGCLQVLKQHGYVGVLSLETEGEYDPEQAQRLIEASRVHLMRVSTEI